MLIARLQNYAESATLQMLIRAQYEKIFSFLVSALWFVNFHWQLLLGVVVVDWTEQWVVRSLNTMGVKQQFTAPERGESNETCERLHWKTSQLNNG